MKRILFALMALCAFTGTYAQGWPSQYDGVMLQGFYWDSYGASRWTTLEKQAKELGQYFNLVWLPQSANCDGTSMGYNDLYWFPGGSNYTSSFGNEAELKSLISTFKANGIGTIADVVINHRRTLNQTLSFPREVYNGTTYQLLSTDICADDKSNWTGSDGQSSKTYANQQGYQVSQNNDTGEDWGGMPDLDHKSQNVQTNVKAYLRMLKDYFGYVGFRYDMVKGFSASFIGDYNSDANPQFSVGECWDGTTTIKNWINGTKVNGQPQSAAFDFQFRYTVRNAINNADWTKLGMQNDGNWPLNSSNTESGSYRRYAVTFVENHDTEKRSNAEQDPIRKDTLAANAFLLAMPGTPCVFFKHWIDCKESIKPMIDARRMAGIHNESAVLNFASNKDYYAVRTTGTNGKLLCVVGTKANSYTPNGSWSKILSGYKYTYYLSSDMETVFIDKGNGEYSQEFDVTLSAVSADANAKLVYTTNGSTPTAQSTQVASGSKVHISGNTTLKVGLLSGGSVKSIQTREYTFSNFTPYNVTVYLKDPQWSQVYFYAWDDMKELNGSWPGKTISDKKTIKGATWYYETFTISKEDYTFNIIFNQGLSKKQTIDIGPINTDKYYEINTTEQGGKLTVNDVTNDMTGVERIYSDGTADGNIYDLQGRKVSDGKSSTYSGTQLPKGIYIRNGKKFVVK